MTHALALSACGYRRFDEFIHPADVAPAIRDESDDDAYGVHVQDFTPDRGARVGTLLRDARASRGWTQDDVIPLIPVSRSTYLRWEKGDFTNPNLSDFRITCDVLGVDRVQVAIALGIIDQNDVDWPPPPPPLDPLLGRIARYLADPKIPDKFKDTLRSGITAALSMWFQMYSYNNPRELTADQRREADSPRDAAQS